jgi:GMP reductase
MDDVKLDFDDVMICPQFTDVDSRKKVMLTTDIKGHWGQTLTGIPIIAANMHGVGTFSMARSLSKLGLFTAINKDVSVKEWFDFFESYENQNSQFYIDGNSYGRMSPAESVFLTLGMDKVDEHGMNMQTNMRKLRMLVAAKCFRKLKIVIDVANGYMNPFYDYIKEVRDIAPDAFIMAGTVCTPDAAVRIVDSGADVARVGIGTGAVCTTRKVAGVGYPQASAIMECSPVVDIECDGGCTDPGDFAKAFALGSSIIMAGSVFAAHKEGEIEPDENGNVLFYGMSSHVAQGQKSDYRSSEGRVVKIPYRGEVRPTVEHILGGLRSACAYSNAKQLSDLQKEAKIIRVNNQLNRVLEKYTI